MKKFGSIVTVIAVEVAVMVVMAPATSAKPPPKADDFQTAMTKAGFSVCELESHGGTILGGYARPDWAVMTDNKPCPQATPTGRPPPFDKQYVTPDGRTGNDL